MKSIKFFAVAALLVISSGTYAQFTNTSTSTSTSSTSSTDGWSSIWVEYNPINVDFTKGIDDESISGFSLGYSHAFPISAGTPIFLEAGLGVQYSTKSDFMEDEFNDVKFTMFSAKVPINLIYDFAIPNSSISIDPFVGLALRYNISGKLSDDDDDIDLFDKDDMGGSKNTFKRFQAGWQIGVKARFGGGFTAGLAYGSDFSNIWEVGDDTKVKAKASTTTLTIGYAF